MKQTAVEWLLEQLNERKCWADSEQCKILFEQAKELEKQQIVEAWDLSRRDIDYPANGKQYYTQKYGNDND